MCLELIFSKMTNITYIQSYYSRNTSVCVYIYIYIIDLYTYEKGSIKIFLF